MQTITAMDEERSHLTKRPSEGKAAARDYAPRTKVGRIRGQYSGKGQEGHRDDGEARPDLGQFISVFESLSLC